MYGGLRQGMDQQTPDPWGMRGVPGAGAGPPGWPGPDGNMNKPLPAQFPPGMTAPIQPPSPMGGPQFQTGGGLQSGPPGMGFGGTAGPPGMQGPMPPWLQSIAALIAQRRGMMGNDPWNPGMGRGPIDPSMIAGPPGVSPMPPGAPGVGGVAGPPGMPPKPPAPVAAPAPPTQVKPNRMAQGRPVTERDGVTGVTGRGGNFQKLGKPAMRRLK